MARGVCIIPAFMAVASKNDIAIFFVSWQGQPAEAHLTLLGSVTEIIIPKHTMREDSHFAQYDLFDLLAVFLGSPSGATFDSVQNNLSWLRGTRSPQNGYHVPSTSTRHLRRKRSGPTKQARQNTLSEIWTSFFVPLSAPYITKRIPNCRWSALHAHRKSSPGFLSIVSLRRDASSAVGSFSSCIPPPTSCGIVTMES